MPEQIWEMIKWCGILIVGVSSVGFWVQRIITFLTEEDTEIKESWIKRAIDFLTEQLEKRNEQTK